MKELSGAERRLLIAAAEQGLFCLCHVYLNDGKTLVNYVRVRGINYIDTNTSDQWYASKHLKAFRDLCKRGYVVHDTDNLYQLTDSGREKAKELAAEEKASPEE